MSQPSVGHTGFRALPARTRRMVRQGALCFLALQALAAASLMLGQKVRTLLRGRHVKPLPPADSTTHHVGEDVTATLYTYGGVLFQDMLGAIASAEHRVLFESFIVKDDHVGQQFKKALIAASERGVEVYVVYDGFANLVVRRSFFRFPAPIHVLRYPLLPGWRFLSPRRYGRDHRKILVVDDKVGFVGGYNIGDDYATQWRDTHLKVEGAAVWDLDNAFVDFWNLRRDEKRPELHQSMAAGWQPQVRAHRNMPRLSTFPIRGMYLEAIDRASHSIDITAAYFIPDRDILAAILEARTRGVAVRIIVPKVSNHVLTDWLSRGFYTQLLDAGVQIHRYKGHMIHAKTATVDGRWSTVGTANIDRLSLLGNWEINVELLDDGFAKGMQEVFEHDRSRSEELTLEEWMSRPMVARAYEWLLKPLGPLL